jgi:hypothetical protein
MSIVSTRNPYVKPTKNLTAKEGGLPHISTIAEKAGFFEDYTGPYSFFSDATHSGVRGLDIYLEFNGDNRAASGFRIKSLYPFVQYYG